MIYIFLHSSKHSVILCALYENHLFGFLLVFVTVWTSSVYLPDVQNHSTYYKVYYQKHRYEWIWKLCFIFMKASIKKTYFLFYSKDTVCKFTEAKFLNSPRMLCPWCWTQSRFPGKTLETHLSYVTFINNVNNCANKAKREAWEPTFDPCYLKTKENSSISWTRSLFALHHKRYLTNLASHLWQHWNTSWLSPLLSFQWLC